MFCAMSLSWREGAREIASSPPSVSRKIFPDFSVQNASSASEIAPEILLPGSESKSESSHSKKVRKRSLSLENGRIL